MLSSSSRTSNAIEREEKLPPKESTRKAMLQITSAIVAITSVLAAVFIPSALQGGSVGVIYRQFALTIAVSTATSAFLALSFTPALCASLLKPTHGQKNALLQMVQPHLRLDLEDVHPPDRQRSRPCALVDDRLRRDRRSVRVRSFRLPGSFLPEEDQGYALAIVQLPPGAAIERTIKVMSQVDRHLEEGSGRPIYLSGQRLQLRRQETMSVSLHPLKPWDTA